MHHEAVDLVVGPNTHEVSRVRALTQRVLTERGESEDLVETAGLVVTELVANALVHTQATARVRLRANEVLRVEVADSCSDPPRPQQPASRDAETGRGLQLVDALATSWGWYQHDDRKVVWCELSHKEHVGARPEG